MSLSIFVSKLWKMKRISTIRLYGNIFEWNLNNAQMMARQIEEAADASDEICLRVHCYGGSVIEGNMIFNAIRNSKIPVNIYIDGIAASMAAILTAAAHRVYMSENAFLMIHAPAGGTGGRGTAAEDIQTAKALSEMEKNFIKALVAKTGKPENEVKKWMTGDNWFSAREALEEGLIDEITDPVAKDVRPLTDVEIRTTTVENIYGLYTAFLNNSETKNKQQMDKAKLIKAFGLTGVTADSTDDEVQAAIQAKLDKEKADKEAAERLLKEHMKAQVNAMLDTVKGKLTREQREQYEAIGENMGIAALETIIAPLRTPSASFNSMIATAGRNPETQAMDRAGWDWNMWQEKDPRGLERMAKEDPEGFNALYKSAFGVESPR